MVIIENHHFTYDYSIKNEVEGTKACAPNRTCVL